MTPQSTQAKTRHTATGLFALLGSLVHVNGAGAPKTTHARRLVLPVLATALGALAFTATPALAAAPEKPETKPATAETATTATLNGVLNPLTSARAGYYFAYSPEISCLIPGFTTPLQAEATVKAKKVEAKVTDLQPNKEYKFCLVATNAEPGGETPGNEVALKTDPAPPEVIAETESAASVTQAEATLSAEINPNNEKTTYFFEYATNPALTGATKLEGAPPAAELENFGPQHIEVPTGAVLHADTTYYYRVTAENAQSKTEGKPVVGKVEHFLTAPETPEGEEANPIGVTDATLKGVLAPNATVTGEAGSYEFLYRQSATECQGGERPEDKAAPVSAGTALGDAKEAVEAPIAGLLPGTRYTFCLLERNATGVALGAPATFITLGAGITNEQAATVEANAATLRADIDPNGSETRYHFEYDTTPYTTSAAHGTSITVEGVGTEVNIGAGTTPVTVEVLLNGLEAGETYYYRVLATNSQSPAGGAPGLGKTFTTVATPGSEPAQSCPNEKLRAEQPFGLKLPDCRAYEMVSPVETGGQDATHPIPDPAPRAAVSGEAVTYSSNGLFGEPTGGTVENQFVSRRGAGGWSTQSVTPPHDPSNTEPEPSYEAGAFDPELTKGITDTNAQLAEGAPGGKGPNELGLYVANFGDSSYQYVAPGVFPYGVSSDLSRVMLGSSEWIDGAMVPVAVTNEGEPLNAIVGAPTPGARGFAGDKDLWQAVSSDGSRVYFTSPGGLEDPGVRQLFVRLNVGQPQSPIDAGKKCTVSTDACTIDVSASQRLQANPAGQQPARYWGASADGSKVFFTSTAELTEDAYTSPSGNAANLYEYQLPTEPGQSGRLTDLTVTEAGNGAAVLGVTQISEDGSYVYFVAEGELATGATPGQPNLYVSHEGSPPRFIATLAESDKADWDNGGFYPETAEAGPEINTAVVNPSGTRMAFLSGGRLKTSNFPEGYDNEQAQPGECEQEFASGLNEMGKCREIYLYDAQTGELVCASCDPAGARPVGSSSFELIPSPRPNGLYRPRNLVEDGALFFNSSDALVPHASDGRRNVYEYEDGHVYAISNVAGGKESFFMDASPSGNDVFFATSDQLLPQDKSENVVVWDARVEGGFPAPAVAPSCDNGDSCKPPASPQPPLFGAGPSETFAGSGNPAPAVVTPPPKKVTKKTVKCKRGFVKNKKGKCIKKPKKKSSKSKRGGKS